MTGGAPLRANIRYALGDAVKLRVWYQVRDMVEARVRDPVELVSQRVQIAAWVHVDREVRG